MSKKISKIKDIDTKIEKIYQLDDELKQAMENESDAIKAFTDNKEKRTVKRVGEEGKEKPVEITNSEIMEEIRITRTLDGEAGRILKEVDEKTYDALRATATKNGELHDYIKETFGFSFKHMNIVDYITLTEAIIEYKLKEHA